MRDFTKGTEWKQIFSFAMPMLLGNVFMQLYQFADTVVVGRFIGKDALAAVGASTPVIFMMIALVMGMGIGASIVISQYFGAKRYDKVQITIDTLMIFLLAAGAAVSVLGYFFSHYILEMLSLPPALMPMARSFMSVYFLGMVMMFGYNAVSAVLRGIGDSITPLYFLIISTLLNVGLDLLFVLSFKWGVAGTAWASVISQGVAFLLAVIYVNGKSKVFKFNILTPRFDMSTFRDCVRMGLPSGIQQTFVAIGAVALSGVVNGFGTDIIAAYSAVNRIDAFVAMPVMSFAAALTSFVGQNAGAGKFIRIKRGLRATLIISTLFCMALSAIMILFGRPILGIFTSDQSVVEHGYRYMVIIYSTYVLFNIMFVNNGMLRGVGATIFPMVMTLLSLWLCRLPAAVILSRHFGVDGIWWSIPVGWTIGLIGSASYYLSGKWRGKSVILEQRASVDEDLVV